MCQYKYSKTKQLVRKKKGALRIVNNEYTDIREIIVRMKVLIIYKLNIYQVFNVMFRIKTNTAPRIFENHGDSSPRFNQI